MHALFVLGATSFFTCLVATPLCRDLFVRVGLVDKPDLQRKFHLRAVPRIGGLPIAISYMAALVLVYFHYSPIKLYIQHRHLFMGLLPAAAVIFATGLLDDVFGLKPWQKLMGQTVGAALAVSLGARLSMMHLHPVFAWLISVVWLLSCTNAVNLIDGMDGLATGVGLLATLSTLFVALLSGNTGLAIATVPLAGALLAFLRYNFSPASVFLGDCGSLTIGFVLGCFGLIWSQNANSMASIAAPLMALALPLLDVGLAVGRRFLRSVPIFSGDRGHIHHRVLALGFTPRGAALLLYLVCGIAAAFAILESLSRDNLGWPIIGIFCGLVLVGVDRLGYVEFRAVRKTLSHAFMRRAVQDHIILEELERALREAPTIESWWQIVREICRTLGFASAELEVNGYFYSEQFIVSGAKATCHIQLKLGDHDLLVLTRLPEQTIPRSMLTVLNHFQSSIKGNALLCSDTVEGFAPITTRTVA